jgi:hypothetical protein
MKALTELGNKPEGQSLTPTTSTAADPNASGVKDIDTVLNEAGQNTSPETGSEVTVEVKPSDETKELKNLPKGKAEICFSHSCTQY